VSFVSCGKSDKSKGREIVVDCLRLSHRGRMEGEDMKALDKTPSRLLPWPIQADGQKWSDDMHLWFLSGGAKDYFTLELPIDSPGRYHLTAYMTCGREYGIVQLKLDDKPVGSQFDGYNDALIRNPVDLGEFELTKGAHSFTVELVGKNEKSNGWLAGLDYISIEPIGKSLRGGAD